MQPVKHHRRHQHLTHPANAICAEIELNGDVTILRKRDGRAVVVPDMLVCCVGYGGTSRSSDPTIWASENSLARFGAWVTIRNPMGLYMRPLR